MALAIEALPLQFGIPGGMELAVILLIAVLLFGANKIPKLARATGQSIGEFRRGHEEVKQELNEMQNPEDAEAGGAEGTASADTTADGGETGGQTDDAEAGTDDEEAEEEEEEE